MADNSITEILILAGGLGSRLRSIVHDVPKPMAEVGGRPFLAHVLDYWEKQGITRVTLSIGYMGNIIRAYFRDSYQTMAIDYAIEENPLGTGGGLRHVLMQRHWQNKRCLLINGDTWFNADLPKLTEDAVRWDLPITLSLKFMQTNTRYASVKLDSRNKIIQFKGNDSDAKYINAGCYVINPRMLKPLLKGMPAVFSFEDDVLTPFASRGLLGTSIQDRQFLDIGLPESYALAEHAVKELLMNPE